MRERERERERERTEFAPECVCPIDGEPEHRMLVEELREHLLTDHTLGERTSALVKMADPSSSSD
ncbi:hypothetical protein [Halococcus sp. IIIV-5B]|uniref:hypothetical protein n=1 Tax=Halococcus sp. IIIV-5B TaxID=2321230 RepID=UPI0011C45BE2|nr:hypothetical protein [Halococcus sp. IIIV-5B]